VSTHDKEAKLQEDILDILSIKTVLTFMYTTTLNQHKLQQQKIW